MKTIIDNTKFIQVILDKYIDNDTVAIDMTCGNGFDSLYLAKKSKKVYCFDIQKEAIENTKKLLEENTLVDKCQLILDSHSKVDEYVKEKVDVVIYNLGFLPHSNNNITTNYQSTIESLEKVLSLLKVNGIVCISIYWGHSAGVIEREKVIAFVSKLDKKYHVGYYQKLNQYNAPEVVFIEKVGS